MLQLIIGLSLGAYFAESIRETVPMLNPDKGDADEVSAVV